MSRPGGEALLAAGRGVLSGASVNLLSEFLAFVDQRLGAGRLCLQAVRGLLERRSAAESLQPEAHHLVRDAWEALDGMGRTVNLALYPLFPDIGLYSPERMMRQCTFYTVRRALHRNRGSASHRVTRLLWHETREEAAPAYCRLSFLNNLTVCVPIPIVDGDKLPGWQDLPPHMAHAVKGQKIDRCPLADGCDEILTWLDGFSDRCLAALAEAVRGMPRS
jgi:hypothetical protein